jgi:glycosyltransferase involved in cell wall biosynthesis
MQAKRRIYSNFQRFKPVAERTREFELVDIDEPGTEWTAWRIFRELRNSDIVIINIDHKRLYQLCLYRTFFFWKRFRLVSADILLRRPTNWKRKLFRYYQRLMLTQVDRFILYFRNTSHYEKLFGLRKDRIRYVPFKVNDWELGIDQYQADPASGEYVICAGQTLRDVKTFVAACEKAKVPAILLTPGKDLMKRHGTHFDADNLPSNVKIEYHTDGKEETFLKWLKEAAIVVIPRFKTDISSSGISTYLSSMAAWRCVVISQGPGAEDVLTDGQAVIVPAEDVDSLAATLKRLWNDPLERSRVAQRGRKYAEYVQGEERLLTDILQSATADS